MLLRLLYYFLRILCATLVHIYYRVYFFEKQHFDLPKGACIMTSNHPNTLIDVLATVAFINRRSHFLANAGLFKQPFFNWMWRKLWCIPIKRRKDNVQHVKNEDSFQECDTFLSKSGLLFIAPEGTSHNERHVREFRPGTAKIAFSAEAKNDFKLGLTICPFGVTYAKPWRFRSRLYVQAGAPIRVADYREQYEKDPEAAIVFLTKVIENQTRNLVVDAADVQQDHLAGKIELILDSEYLSAETIPLTTNEQFLRAQNVVTQLKNLQQKNEEDYRNVENIVNQYFMKIKKYKTSEYALILGPEHWIATTLLNIIAFPFFLYGFVFNIIPLFLTDKIWQKLNLADYEATVRIGVGGLIVFPLCYWAELHLVQYWLNFPFLGLLFWILNIILGIFAWNYVEGLHFIQQCSNIKSLSRQERENLWQQRTTILQYFK